MIKFFKIFLPIILVLLAIIGFLYKSVKSLADVLEDNETDWQEEADEWDL